MMTEVHHFSDIRSSRVKMKYNSMTSKCWQHPNVFLVISCYHRRSIKESTQEPTIIYSTNLYKLCNQQQKPVAVFVSSPSPIFCVVDPALVTRPNIGRTSTHRTFPQPSKAREVVDNPINGQPKTFFGRQFLAAKNQWIISGWWLGHPSEK